jgi:peptide/nickel transport system substrate-binding protein
MLHKRKFGFLLSGLTAIALVLTAVASQPARAQGTLVWGLPAGASVLDPHVLCGWLGRGVSHQIFESFADSDLSQPWESGPAPLKPQLATSWDVSDDGLVYTYYLREGVKFHDGTDFNADAVKVNFDRFMDTESPYYSELANAYFVFTGYGAYIASYEIVDPMTFSVTLTEPNYEWMRMGLEDCPTMHFISAAAIAEYGDAGLPLHPVGTGPFKFVEREEGVKIVLERNDDYWDEPAKLDSIVFVQLEDPATRLNAFRAGEINIVQEPPWDEIESLEDEGFVLTANENPPSIWYLIFNFNNPVMQDVRVREAINLAIDREGIVTQILQGTGVPAYEMLSRGTTAYRAGDVDWGYDPDRARELLAEAGYADGLTIDFDIAQYGYGELVEKWVQRDLKKVGINADMNKMEWLAYLDKWNAGMPDELEMNTIGWGQQTASWTGLVTRCDRWPWDGSNVGWYCNDAADALLTQALNEPDEEKAGELYRQANEIIMGEDWAFAPIYHYSNPIMTAPTVKGFVNSTANWWDLKGVYIEE